MYVGTYSIDENGTHVKECLYMYFKIVQIKEIKLQFRIGKKKITTEKSMSCTTLIL